MQKWKTDVSENASNTFFLLHHMSGLLYYTHSPMLQFLTRHSNITHCNTMTSGKQHVCSPITDCCLKVFMFTSLLFLTRRPQKSNWIFVCLGYISEETSSDTSELCLTAFCCFLECSCKYFTSLIPGCIAFDPLM